MARWLGIDVSTTTVRVALLASSYRKLTLEALREERLADHADAVSALRAASQGLRPEACAAALDGRRAYTRKLDLPRAALKDLENVLAFEVEATLPVELEDSVMDHRRLAPLPGSTANAETVAILAGVAPASAVRERVDLVKAGVGVDPSRIGLGPLALLNLGQVSRELAGETPVVLVELAEDGGDVVIASGGEPRMLRSLTRGIQGLPEDAPRLARELKQTFAAWRASGGSPLDRVIVTGPGVDVPGLEGFLANELGLALGALPTLGLEVPTALMGQTTRFARAISLALSLSRRPADLNLRRGALEAQQSFQFLREKQPILSGLAAALLVSLGFAAFAEQRALESERKGLEDELAATTQVYFGTATRDPKEAADLLDAAISGKSDDPMPALDAFDVMQALSERIPPSLVHDVVDLDFKKNQLSLKGLVNTIDDANTVEKSVAEHPCFKDVNLSHTTKLKEKNKQKYTLELKIDCGKAKADKKPAGPAPSASGGAGR
ncbi:MAG: PilN domain-containing protein [Deltaproteobacteria bacterium]|nr:PilN domain-containing protein [Deltaproteobacteria bacterium]